MKRCRIPKGKMHVSGFPISMRDIEAIHPNSVFKSIITRGNWLGKLNISKQAKRLTYLRDKYFIKAVNEIIDRV